MEVIDEIKSKVTMREVLEHYGIYPTRGSNIYKCFVHDDHSPSANIIKNSNKFHCFACGYSGDIFDVVEHFEKCDKKKAIQIINDIFHLGILNGSDIDPKELRKMQKQREKERKEKQYWDDISKKVWQKLRYARQYWGLINAKFHPTKGQIANDTWTSMEEHIFYESLKKIRLIDFLFEAVDGYKSFDEELYYIYGNNGKELMKKIMKGVIKL